MKPVAVALATPVAGLTSQQCMFASTCGNWLVGGGGGGGQQQQQQQYRLSCSSLSSCSQVQFVNASLCSVTTCGNGAGHSLVVQEVSAGASHRMAVQSCDSSFAAGCSGLRRVGRGMDSGGRLNGGGCGHYRLARLRCLGSGDLSNNNNNSSNGPSERASRRDGASDGSEGEAETGNGGGTEEEVASSSVWDLQARRKRMQAAAAKMGDPLLNMMSNASKKLQDYLDNYKQTRAKDTASVATTGRKEAAGVALETKWEQWQKVFAEAEEQESLATVLRFQMEEAVAIEDFQEAARLKGALDAVTATDTVAEVMVELKRALEEERYSDAALYRDKAGAGLVGWWAGLAEGENDPYGRIIKIYPAHGRLVAKGFSARQLATAAEGAALFEVFITKEGERDFQQQAVYLQREFNVAESSAGLSKSMDLNMLDLENLAEDSSRDLKRTKDLLEDESGENKGKVEDAALSDEGLDKIMSFLKNRMPHVKLKVFKVIALEESEADIPKIVEKMMEAEEESRKQEDAGESNTTTRNGENAVGNKFPLDGKIPVGSRSSTIGEEEEKDNPIRLVVGGVLQNSVDSAPPRLPVRVPARLEPTSRNSFNFHIEDLDNSPAGAPLNEVAPSWKVATIATQAAADLMPDDVAKVLWNVEKVPVKVSKEIADIIRLAISQVQRRQGLFKCTSFSRINVSKSSTDPLSGLYIGAFGPYTSEVVQLHRKYGHWENEQTSSSGQNLEFFEYVEAVKLTGDLNVPAGQVTFRARIGSESRFSHRGVYPEELGVVARYEGQGRLAEPGFRNPQWINGELVLLDGKGGNHTNGAALGFVYSVPERHFLVLFKRLCLSD